MARSAAACRAVLSRAYTANKNALTGVWHRTRSRSEHENAEGVVRKGPFTNESFVPGGDSPLLLGDSLALVFV